MTPRRIPFLDLRVTDVAEREALLAACETVLSHGRLINGPEVAALETRVAAWCGRRFAVGVGSGTDALFLALRCLGVGPGDEVITTSLSWIATANAIALTGARPVFADVGDDLNVDPQSVHALVTPRTRALVPVHYAGKVCRMDTLLAIARQHDLAVVEDASQAFGATHRGRVAGAFGELAAFSLNPMKLLGACGEAGVILTDRPTLYERLLALRHNGMIDREVCVTPGLNGRLDTLQAAMLLRRLERVDAVIARRRAVARRYGECLAGVVETPVEAADERDVFYTYTVRTDRRDDLRTFLVTHGVEAMVRDPILMPDQPAYRTDRPADIPNARRLVGRLLSLPAHEKLERDDIDHVAASVRTFFHGEPALAAGGHR